MRPVRTVAVLVALVLIAGVAWLAIPRGDAGDEAVAPTSSVPTPSTEVPTTVGTDPAGPGPSVTVGDEPDDAPPTAIPVAPQVEQQIATDGEATVIVRLAVPVTGTDEEKAEAAARATADLLAQLPAGSYSDVAASDTVPVATFSVDAAGLEALRRSDLVDSVAADEFKTVSSVNATTTIGAPAAWSAGWKGTGATVAILDSGVQSAHTYLSAGGGSKVIAEACFGTNAQGYVPACPGQVPATSGPGTAARAPRPSAPAGTAPTWPASPPVGSGPPASCLRAWLRGHRSSPSRSSA